ncbi:hypothetical protein GE21DRAFT_1023303 [Neurospora crassa]|nr:hypothetical protein GE21DRAFT_1023303 [Neurospora crassa]
MWQTLSLYRAKPLYYPPPLHRLGIFIPLRLSSPCLSCRSFPSTNAQSQLPLYPPHAGDCYPLAGAFQRSGSYSQAVSYPLAVGDESDLAFHRAVSYSPVTHEASACGLGYGSDEVNMDSSSFYSFVIVVSLSIKITCRHLPSCLFVSISYPTATIGLPVSSFTRHFTRYFHSHTLVVVAGRIIFLYS